MASSISQTNSIFQQPWWLDAVAPGQWDAIVISKNDEAIARMPVVVKKRYGLTLITMPQLTQTLGPWLASSEAKYTNRLSEEIHLCNEIVRRLPGHDFFLQQFSPAITNWLSFYWAGFSATTHYTYRIEDLTDLDRVWFDFRSNVRGKIRKAQKAVQIRDDLGIESFLEVGAKPFLRQGMRVPYDPACVRRLDLACTEHAARRILFAEDEQRRIHAAIYIVWDSNVAYYLMGGADPALRDTGAQSLLVWEAIKFAAEKAKCFDFEGSMLESVESSFRAFGARQVPYFRISRASRRMRLLLGANHLFAALTGRPFSRAFES